MISADGFHVGNIERVVTDTETGRINQFVISQGLLPKSRKLIPFHWVDFFDDDKVLLSADLYQLEETEGTKN